MQKLKPTAVSDLLNNAVDHSSVIFQCKQLLKLENLLHELLPEPLRQNCGIANFINGQLTLYSRSPAWCYKLRTHARKISKMMKKKGISIKKVHVIVVQEDVKPLTSSLPKPSLSESQKQIIREAIEKLDNPELASILQSFVNRTD